MLLWLKKFLGLLLISGNSSSCLILTTKSEFGNEN